MKKLISILLAAILLFTCAFALGEGQTPPDKPDGEMSAPPDGNGPGGTPPDGNGPGGTPPDGNGPGGTPPDGNGPGGTPPDGNGPGGTPPDGNGPGGMGMPGGGSGGAPESYDAVTTADSDAELTEDISSTGTDENALLVTGGNVSLTGASVNRASNDSTGGDSASFYGVGAAILATGGALTIENAVIDTDAAGGTGVFSYGDGTVYVSDTTISTQQNTSGGIHVAGGGKLYAENLTVTTQGNSSAAIRSDRGSGAMIVDGGSYTANGSGSPAVYVTADITIRNAELTATGSEALCLEGLNAVRLYDCALTGAMPDDSQNDNTWTVILYQSMSGDAQVGQGSFEMDGGKLVSENGGLFYTTNTESVFVIRDVEIEAAEDSEYFLRCTGNANQRGWGSVGSNGADCEFTAIAQAMDGDIVWDSVSELDLYVTEGSVLTGRVVDDESCAGSGGNGYCRLVIDEASSWIVTGDSAVTILECAGEIRDEQGSAVTILGSDGTVYAQGDSQYTVTVESYSDAADVTGAGSVSSFEAHSQL